MNCLVWYWLNLQCLNEHDDIYFKDEILKMRTKTEI